MAKILFTTSSFDLNNFEDRHLVEDLGYELVVNPFGKRLSEKQVKELIDDEVVAIVAGLEPLTEDVLSHSKSLKIIVRCGIGLDNVDLETASRLGIMVYNTPDAPTRSVAELTLAHILSLSRRISECDNQLRKGNWSPLMGRLISKQTIGIIGFGRIGKLLSELLQGLGAKVIVHDPFSMENKVNIDLVSLETLLSLSDIVTLHLPYTPETHHLIGEKELQLMKSSALLINVARGGIIDENALLESLKINRIAGAALDCFEEEPYSGPLLAINNIQLTAHMGSYAKEARTMMEGESCIKLIEGLRTLGFIKS